MIDVILILATHALFVSADQSVVFCTEITGFKVEVGVLCLRTSREGVSMVIVPPVRGRKPPLLCDPSGKYNADEGMTKNRKVMRRRVGKTTRVDMTGMKLERFEQTSSQTSSRTVCAACRGFRRHGRDVVGFQENCECDRMKAGAGGPSRSKQSCRV